MTVRRSRRLLATALLTGVAFALHVPFAFAQAEPTPGQVDLSVSAAEPGDLVEVSLAGWPAGLLTVTICGDSAQHGSADCNLNVTAAVMSVGNGESHTSLTVGAPPVPCPCVVRAATRFNDLVRTVPIQVIGVPVVGSPPPSDPLTVSARLEPAAGHSGVVDRVRGWLGGPLRQQLVLTVRNNTSTPMDTLSLQAVLGDAGGGDAMATPTVQPLQPEETRTYVIPFEVAAPSWGSRHVQGAVYGLPTPVHYDVSLHSTPWLLYVLGGVFVVDVVSWRVVRHRRRRADAGLPGGERVESVRQTADEHMLRTPGAVLAAD